MRQRRRRNPIFDTGDLIVIGGVAAGAYLLYMWWKKPPSPNAPTTLISNAIANIWNKLTLSPALKVLGDVVLADGTNIGPLSSMQVATDPSGNVYVQSDGNVYQLGRSDSNGNWPASIVLDTNFGVTGAGW